MFFESASGCIYDIIENHISNVHHSGNPKPLAATVNMEVFSKIPCFVDAFKLVKYVNIFRVYQ